MNVKYSAQGGYEYM